MRSEANVPVQEPPRTAVSERLSGVEEIKLQREEERQRLEQQKEAKAKQRQLEREARLAKIRPPPTLDPPEPEGEPMIIEEHPKLEDTVATLKRRAIKCGAEFGEEQVRQAYVAVKRHANPAVLMRGENEMRKKRMERFGVVAKPTPESKKKSHRRLRKSEMRDPIVEPSETSSERNNAVYVYGLDRHISQNRVFAAFEKFVPTHIEWINATSCNLLFETAEQAEALLDSCELYVPETKPEQAKAESTTTTSTVGGFTGEVEENADIDDEADVGSESKRPFLLVNAKEIAQTSLADRAATKPDDELDEKCIASSETATTVLAHEATDAEKETAADAATEAETEGEGVGPAEVVFPWKQLLHCTDRTRYVLRLRKATNEDIKPLVLEEEHRRRQREGYYGGGRRHSYEGQSRKRSRGRKRSADRQDQNDRRRSHGGRSDKRRRGDRAGSGESRGGRGSISLEGLEKYLKKDSGGGLPTETAASSPAPKPPATDDGAPTTAE